MDAFVFPARAPKRAAGNGITATGSDQGHSIKPDRIPASLLLGRVVRLSVCPS